YPAGVRKRVGRGAVPRARLSAAAAVPVAMRNQAARCAAGGKDCVEVAAIDCAQFRPKRKLEILDLSDEVEIDGEVERAAHALDAMISAHLEAGGNRYVLAAACVWGGVKEMSEITSSQSAGAALRTIADEIDPPVNVPPSQIPARSD